MNHDPADLERARAAAIHEAGGQAALDALLANAGSFVAAHERPVVEGWLNDPSTAAHGVRILRTEAEKRAVTQADPATDRAAYVNLRDAALNGDTAAREKILTMGRPRF